MDAFEVYVNGEKLYTAGLPGGPLVVTACAGDRGGFGLYVGGLDGTAWEHADWATPPINVGDEIKLVAVRSDAVDAPAERRPADPAKRRPSS